MNRGVCFYCGKALRKVRRQDAKYCDSTCRMAALRQRRRTQKERRQSAAPGQTGQSIGEMASSPLPTNSAQACQTLRAQLLGHREGRPTLHTHPFLQTVADAAACELALKELTNRLLEIKKYRERAAEQWLTDAGCQGPPNVIALGPGIVIAGCEEAAQRQVAKAAQGPWDRPM